MRPEAAPPSPGAEFFRCDITSEDNVDALFAGIPHLDILINCAGIGAVGRIDKRFTEMNFTSCC